MSNASARGSLRSPHDQSACGYEKPMACRPCSSGRLTAGCPPPPRRRGGPLQDAPRGGLGSSSAPEHAAPHSRRRKPEVSAQQIGAPHNAGEGRGVCQSPRGGVALSVIGGDGHFLGEARALSESADRLTTSGASNPGARRQETARPQPPAVTRNVPDETAGRRFPPRPRVEP